MQYCLKCGNPLVTAQIDGRERKTCSTSCGYVLWDNPVPVVAAIVEYNGAVVLVRNQAWTQKFLGLVTGFLEKGESPDAAILREVKEELGLDGTITSFIGNYSFFQMNQLIIVYHIQATGTIALNDELAEYKLIPPEKLRPWEFGTGPAVKDWLANRNQTS
ncbi:MAG: NUDIX domain-containing protein [Chloroflexi bacterium]|nr:NUDIX domain-containing protein [Chloroflexota bacterium]